MKKILISAILILGLVAFTIPAFAGSKATADAGATAEGTFSNTISFPESKDLTSVNNNGSGYRGFPMGVQMTYPGFPTYLNGPTDGASVTDLETYLMYGNSFDIATLDAIVNQGGLDWLGVNGMKVITTAECAQTSEKPAAVKALLKKQVKGTYKRVATITVKATNLNVTSERLLAAAAFEAASYGASEIHIIDSGKHRVMSGSGWGIGLYYYAASLSAAETSGGMGGGGTGYSQGESGYQDKPWVKVIAVIPAK